MPLRNANDLKGKITKNYRTEMRKILMEKYFKGWSQAYFESEAFPADMEAHITGRMLEFEQHVIPWVAEVFDLTDHLVLEIGCGTGSSTIPFANRAGQLHAYDISENSIDVSRLRACLMQAQNIQFHLLDSDWAASRESVTASLSSQGAPDVILMIALLEHLTFSERLNILQGAFNILKPGGIIVIYETPNRLNYFDWHTYLMPFADWLPDDLLAEYAANSSRASALGAISSNLYLYRIGRGLSYHEFQLALKDIPWRIINDGFSQWLNKLRPPAIPAYYQALAQIFDAHLPDVPKSFISPSLDLILQKPSGPLDSSHHFQSERINAWLYPEASSIPVDQGIESLPPEMLNSRLIRFVLRLQSNSIYVTLRDWYWRLTGFKK
ncbi:MAG: class I SAM-dependent methyltransferase [Chloroflexota bacterium]